MENNKNQGVLFTNTQKTSEKHPDFRGTINVEGKEYDIAAWKKTSQKGTHYLSISVSEPFRKDAAPKPSAPAAAPVEDDNDPF